MFRLSIYLLQVLFVHGIILTGDCPKEVLPSHSLESVLSVTSKSGGANIIVGIPFVEHTSNLFQNFGYDSKLVFQITSEIVNNSTAALKIVGALRLGFVFILSEIISWEDDQLTINSTVTSNDIQVCHPPTSDTLRVWFEDDFLIFWSCRNSEFPGKHDEAVLIALADYAINVEGLEWAHWIERINIKIKRVAHKYLNFDILNEVDWWDPHKKTSRSVNTNPYHCSRPRIFGNIWELSNIIAVYIVLVIIICAVRYNPTIVCRLFKRYRQVHPYKI